MPCNWNNKIAVITGAASGIGQGLADHAAGLGMKLVLADINEAALAEVAASLKPAEVIAIPTDVSDLSSVERLAARAFEHFGRIDLLFNNAGIMAAGFSWEIHPEQFQRALDININGVINGARAFVPRLLKQSGTAIIVNTASIGGLLASPLMAPYSVSKFAVVAFTESLQAELAMLGASVQVSLLCPGPVESAIFTNPLGTHAGNPAVTQFVDQLQQHLRDDGISPAELAKRAFAGIETGQFWLIPQPESLKSPLQEKVSKILNTL